MRKSGRRFAKLRNAIGANAARDQIDGAGSGCLMRGAHFGGGRLQNAAVGGKGFAKADDYKLVIKAKKDLRAGNKDGNE